MAYSDITITDKDSVPHKGHALDVKVEAKGGHAFVPVLQGVLAAPADTAVQIQITDMIIDEDNYSEDLGDISKADIVVNGKKYYDCRRAGGALSPSEAAPGKTAYNGTLIYTGYIYHA